MGQAKRNREAGVKRIKPVVIVNVDENVSYEKMVGESWQAMIACHQCKQCGYLVPFEFDPFNPESSKQTESVVTQMIDHMQEEGTLGLLERGVATMEDLWVDVDEVAQA